MKIILAMIALMFFSVPQSAPLAQEPAKPSGCGAMDFVCRIQVLEAALRSANESIRWLEKRGGGGGVSKRELKQLAGQVEDLRKLVSALRGEFDAWKNHTHELPSTGASAVPTPAPPSPSVISDLERRILDLETEIPLRKAEIQELTSRMGAVEGKLIRRANRFEAAGWGSIHLGGKAVGGLGAIVWPIGQDGDWAFRGAFGVGQNWTSLKGESYRAIDFLVKADLLRRWDVISAGFSALSELAVVRKGVREVSWLSGITARADYLWFFAQATGGVGREMTSFDKLRWNGGGTFEAGCVFPW